MLQQNAVEGLRGLRASHVTATDTRLSDSRLQAVGLASAYRQWCWSYIIYDPEAQVRIEGPILLIQWLESEFLAGTDPATAAAARGYPTRAQGPSLFSSLLCKRQHA